MFYFYFLTREQRTGESTVGVSSHAQPVKPVKKGDTKPHSARSLQNGAKPHSARSVKSSADKSKFIQENDDLDTCVETDIGTDLGTDFVNVFFQKKQELNKRREQLKSKGETAKNQSDTPKNKNKKPSGNKEAPQNKDKISTDRKQEKEIRKSVVSHIFGVDDSDDDLTQVSALNPGVSKDKIEFSPLQKDKVQKKVVLSDSEEDDNGTDVNANFNVFVANKKERQKSQSEIEEDLFNQEFENSQNRRNQNFQPQVSTSKENEAERKDSNNASLSNARSFFEEVDAKYRTSHSGVLQDETPQAMVKACPECGEVNKVYVTWCIECGAVLSDVKPVPFLPKKSHTPRDITEKLTAKSTHISTEAEKSFKNKLEDSLNEQHFRTAKKQPIINGVKTSEDQASSATGNVNESDNFEYEMIQSPVRTMSEPLKSALSLDLRTSTDSSCVASSTNSGLLAPQGINKSGQIGGAYIAKKSSSARKKAGQHSELARMSEKLDFVYNEMESPKKSMSHALQKELSLQLSVDSSMESNLVEKLAAAGKLVL